MSFMKRCVCVCVFVFGRYLGIYDKYSNLLDHSARQDILSFLQQKHFLQGFVKVNTHTCTHTHPHTILKMYELQFIYTDCRH